MRDTYTPGHSHSQGDSHSPQFRISNFEFPHDLTPLQHSSMSMSMSCVHVHVHVHDAGYAFGYMLYACIYTRLVLYQDATATFTAACCTGPHAALTSRAPLTLRVVNAAGSSAGQAGKRRIVPLLGGRCASTSTTAWLSPAFSTPPPGACARKLALLARCAAT
jgi:hypothetical protein